MRMNLRSFLHEVDGLLRDMSKSELEAFIHETGRILPEKDRKDFLDLLRKFSAGWFWQCFRVWKDQVGMEAGEQQKYIQWLAKLIQKRVKGIMEANRRNYYGECASYIAAFGEMLESRGETGAKQRVLMEYKTLYARRSAFHQELRAFGLAEKKK